MAAITRTVYSTSNSDYQSWQCELLEATFRSVGQPGRIVRLCSEDSGHPSRPFDGSTIAEVVCMPCWMENEETGDRWGIANKPASMKLWLEADRSVRDEDVVLFVDPDMVFLSRVEADLAPGEILGQRWVDEGIEQHPKWEKYGAHVRDRITRDAIVMYPFCATAGDMRRIVDRFIEVSHAIRADDRECWIADMFGLVIAMLEAGLEIHTRDDLGVCNSWERHRDRLPQIIHYPWPVFDADGKTLWFKQSYTPATKSRPWRRPPLPSRATSVVEEKLLTLIHEHVDRQEAAQESEGLAWFRESLGSGP